MDSNGNSAKNSRSSTRKREEDVFLRSRRENEPKEEYLLWKYLDTFDTVLTALKELNDDMQVSESDPLSIVDHLKCLFCHRDKGASPSFDSSALYRKHCELIEKFSQLEDMVNRVENVLSRKTVRNLTNLLEDCQKNMLAFQDGMKEFQYFGAMERHIVDIVILYEKFSRFTVKMATQNDRLLGLIKSHYRNKYEKTRRYSC